MAAGICCGSDLNLVVADYRDFGASREVHRRRRIRSAGGVSLDVPSAGGPALVVFNIHDAAIDVGDSEVGVYAGQVDRVVGVGRIDCERARGAGDRPAEVDNTDIVCGAITLTADGQVVGV